MGRIVNRMVQGKMEMPPVHHKQGLKEGLPGWLSGKESSCQCRRCEFNPWVRKIFWRRKWQPTPVFLPKKIPWTEEPGRPQSMRSQRVGHDLAAKPPPPYVNIQLIYFAVQQKHNTVKQLYSNKHF